MNVPNAFYIPLAPVVPRVGFAEVRVGSMGFALGAPGFALGPRGISDTNMLVSEMQKSRVAFAQREGVCILVECRPKCN